MTSMTENESGPFPVTAKRTFIWIIAMGAAKETRAVVLKPGGTAFRLAVKAEERPSGDRHD